MITFFLSLLGISVSAMAQEADSGGGLRMAAIKANVAETVVTDDPPVQAMAPEDAEGNGENEDVQEFVPTRTVKDNFGGFNWTLRILLGVTPYEGGEQSNRLGYPYPDWEPAGGVETEFCYLVGDEVFAGPRVALALGAPWFLSVELTAQVNVPLTRQSAFVTSFGVAYSLFVSLALPETLQVVDEKVESSRLYFSDATISKDLYGLFFPLQVGYQHVSESGFIFGVNLEMDIGFRSNRTVYYAIERINKVGDQYVNYIGNKDKLGLVMDFFGVGISLGYSAPGK